jgi:hypothetical protein
MLDSDDELFSGVRSEPLAPQASQAAHSDALGMSDVDLKFFKFGDNDETQWSGTALVLRNTLESLDNQPTFWHLREFFYSLGWGASIRLDMWLRSGVIGGWTFDVQCILFNVVLVCFSTRWYVL